MVEYIKVLHVLAIISWMAGLLYLPRLFVYHTSAALDSDTYNTFNIMERRLYKAIMVPAMVVSWMTGLYLAWVNFRFLGGWLHAKILFVVLMSIHHWFQGTWIKKFATGRNTHSERFFRIQNEVPTLLMVGIVFFVIVKPF